MKKTIQYIFVALLLIALTFSAEAATQWTNYRIMLDPGHGGTDPGASGPSAPHEATLALRCGKALQSRIVNECGGTVKMTRTTDTFISLSSRRSMSVSYDPYIFCSIHLNAFNGTAKGTETYYYWTTGNSSVLANKVQAQLIANFKTVSGFTPTNRGVKTAAYTVITGSSNVPAILTEGLFVDNSTEWNIINTESKDGFKKWVQGHLYGFYDRLVLLNSSIIDPSASTTTTPDPTWTVTPTEWVFSCVEGASSTLDVTIKGSNLTATPTATISGTGFSIASSSLTKTNSTVTVKFAPTAAGSYSGTLTLKSGTLSKKVTLTGTATAAPLTFTEVWNHSDNAGTLTNEGWNAGAVRNMTYNAGKLYMVYNHSDIKVVNAQTGADLGNLNKAGVEGGTLTLCDVKACDGKIVACNLAVTNQTLRVYVWDNDQSNPRLLLETTEFGGAARIGDCIGFYGTWTSGKLAFGHFANDATRIIEYTIIDGVCSTTPTIINATTDGTTILNTGTTTRVYPDATGYWIDGKNNHTTRLGTTGQREFYIDSDETWGTAFETFTWKGTEYALTTMFNTMEGDNWTSQTDEQKALNYTGGRMKLLKKVADWGDAEDCGDYPSAGLSTSIQNTNCTTNAIASVNGTSGVEAWVLSTGQGIAYYKYGTAPSYTVEEIVPLSASVTSSKSAVELSAEVGSNATTKVTVSGANLAGDINLEITGTDADMFNIDVQTIAQAIATAEVTITYTPTAAGEHTASLAITSTDAETVTVALTGSAKDALTVPVLTKLWKYTYDSSNETRPIARFAAAHNGTIYVQQSGTLYSWTTSSEKQSALTDASLAGYAITCDDAGNIVYTTNPYTNGATSWAYIKNGKATTFTLTLPSVFTSGTYNSTQTPSRIIGDITSADGGYMWLGNWTTANAVMIHMANMGTSSQSVTCTPSSAFSANFSTVYNVQPMLTLISEIKSMTATEAADKLYARNRNNKYVEYLDGTVVKQYAAPSGAYTTMGFDVFELNGVKYALQPLGTTYTTSFAVVELASGSIIAKNADEDVTTAVETIGIAGTQAESKYYNTLLAEKVSETKANIYQYMLGTQVAMYTFEIPNNFTTGIEGVIDETMEEADAPVEYYNLQGVRVMNPENGLYIKRQGNKVTKVIL